MAIAVCVDDVLFFGPDETEMKKVIDELQANGCELKLEKEGSSDTCDFLGIKLVEKDGVLKLTQHGLIKKFLETVGCTDCNPAETPAATSPLGTDVHGEMFHESWEHASAVGILMHLAGNAHPEIQFAGPCDGRRAWSPVSSFENMTWRLVSVMKNIWPELS